MTNERRDRTPLRVTQHARDRFRERVPFAADWTDDALDRCLIKLTEAARGGAAIDGMWPLDLHGIVYVRAVTVGRAIVTVTPKVVPNPLRGRDQRPTLGGRKNTRLQDGAKRARRKNAVEQAQKRASRLNGGS